MNEQEILRGRLNDEILDDLRQYIGADSKEQTEAASTAAISTMVEGLEKNAESDNGRSQLLNALDRDHDGSILDDAGGFLFGRKKPKNPKTINGPGILEHIFGNRQSRVAEGIGRSTGLNKTQILKLMVTLAPLVLGALGKRKSASRSGFGANDILDLLRNTVQTRRSMTNDQGLLSKLLDPNGDDGILDDLARLGMNAFLSRSK